MANPDHKLLVGCDGLTRVVAARPVSAVAVGGLMAEHVAAALGADAKGVAVVSAICGEPDPEDSARALATEVVRPQGA